MENILTEQNKVLTFQEYQNWLNKWKNNKMRLLSLLSYLFAQI